MKLLDEIRYHIFLGGGPPSANGPGSGHYQRFQRQALANLDVMSRTSHGTARTADRPGLSQEGQKLADAAKANFQKGMDWVWEHKDDPMDNGAQVRNMVDALSSTLNSGLLKPGQSPWRTWDDKGFGYVPAAGIQKGLDTFSQQLSDRLKTEKPGDTAAWAEKEFQRIHPLADGVGRATMALAAFVLARGGESLPKYRSREEHFAAINSLAPGNWEHYYRGLFNQGPNSALMPTFQKSGIAASFSQIRSDAAHHNLRR